MCGAVVVATVPTPRIARWDREKFCSVFRSHIDLIRFGGNSTPLDQYSYYIPTGIHLVHPYSSTPTRLTSTSNSKNFCQVSCSRTDVVVVIGAKTKTDLLQDSSIIHKSVVRWFRVVVFSLVDAIFCQHTLTTHTPLFNKINNCIADSNFVLIWF